MPRSAATRRAFTRFTRSSVTGSRRPAEHRAGQDLGVALGDGSRHRHLDAGHVLGVELHDEPAQALGEGDEGTQLAHQRRIAHRNVDGELDQLAVAEGHELARHVYRHVDLGLLGVGAQVRGDDHARMLDQRGARLRCSAAPRSTRRWRRPRRDRIRAPASRSPSWMMPPRAQFTSRTPGRVRASSAAATMCSVSDVSGTWNGDEVRLAPAGSRSR